ncbi:cytochrome P450 [Thamnocephalis sphaerospora]|uniref:Cytochrome P450 n=1 Tax=Thamnocephalis sphaerospora TaxID=78915 RepID=A0A4P9XKS0_9FUNG|nr:cytochrome P450 [Thamnocephalis sphaerospora]|eukprot:RKP06407.1 cytochrome P450 [Thamnocephalis sphaerospora]
MSSDVIASLVSILFDWHTVGLAVGALFLSKIVRDEIFSPLARLPGMRPAFLGGLYANSGFVTGKYQQNFAAWHKRYGRIYRVDENMIFLSDPGCALQLLGSSTYPKGPIYQSLEFHQDNIFSTRDPVFHKRQHRLMSPVFSAKSIGDMESLVRESGVDGMIERVAEYADSGSTFDILELLLCMTLDVIGEVSFGKSFGALSKKQGENGTNILHWIDDTAALGLLKYGLGSLCQPWLMPGLFNSERRLVEFARNAIQRRRSIEAGQDGRPRDVLQRLLDAEDSETGEKLTDDQLIAESMVQLIGGTETTALTLTWQDTQFLDGEPAVYGDPVKNLPYLNAVLHEAMRMRPPAIVTFRETPPGGLELCGHFIPEKCAVYISIYGIHHLPEVYGEDADYFRPERWIDSSPEQLTRMRQMFLAFSMGSRACIGRNLAWMELRMALATLLRRYTFHIPDGVKNDMEMLLKFALRPRGGQLRVMATARAD